MCADHTNPGHFAAITLHFRDHCITASCVDSLLADGWMPVLIWDNTEDDGASAARLRERYGNDRRVVIATAGRNLGFGPGMNAALAELSVLGVAGPVLLINNDATVRPGMRSEMQNVVPRGSVPALLAPRVEQRGAVDGWMFYQPWLGMVTKRGLVGSHSYLSGCCLLVVRRDTTSPLFDPSFFMYGEDVELSYRWRRQGGRLILLDEAWVTHVGSASSRDASDFYERCLVRAHCLLARKLAGGRVQQVIMTLLRVPTLALRATLRALRSRSLRPLRALSEIVRPLHLGDLPAQGSGQDGGPRPLSQ